MHSNAGRRHPKKEEKKFNDWCCSKGAPVDVGWCKTHNKKETIPWHERDGRRISGREMVVVHGGIHYVVEGGLE